MTPANTSPVSVGPDHLVAVLRTRAVQQGDHPSFNFIDRTQGIQSLTNRELDRNARAIAVSLSELEGERALILLPQGKDFLAALFGCFYAGVIAVPAYPPAPRRSGRNRERLDPIIQDSKPKIVLTNETVGTRMRSLDDPLLNNLPHLLVDQVDPETAETWQAPELGEDSVAMLQFTSGSTGHPKGVILTHGNLMVNQEMIRQRFGTTADDRILSWLPVYHDMGLIGTVLHPLYVGASAWFTSAKQFLARPRVWLEAIAEHRATISGAPNFAYALCNQRIDLTAVTGLDLSNWRVAFCGAEPVKQSTLIGFAEKFAPLGFSEEAFVPCYGLAEATLMVAALKVGERPWFHQGRVSCGRPCLETHIVAPSSRTILEDGAEGEIWIKGDSVSPGYYAHPIETRKDFRAYLSDGEGPYLRTGDLGFLWQGSLFISGRLKDIIIIRGRNHHAEDLEAHALSVIPQAQDAAAFAVESQQGDELVLIIEIASKRYPNQDVETTAKAALSEGFGITPTQVLMVRSGKLPRTTSGKIKRSACKDAYEQGWFDKLAIKPKPKLCLLNPDDDSGSQTLIWLKDYLAQQLSSKVLDEKRSLTSLGLDSLDVTVLAHQIEEQFGIHLSSDFLLDGVSPTDLALHIDRLKQETQPESQPITTSLKDFPLSTNQKGLWFLQQLHPDNSAYHISRALSLYDVDIIRLEKAIISCLQFHIMTRVAIVDHDGSPYQHINPPPTSITLVDISDWEESQLRDMAAEWASRPFAAGESLLRVLLLKRPNREYVLHLTVHHVAIDFWSLVLILKDLEHCYRLDTGLGDPGNPYGDYIRNQDQSLQCQRGKVLQAFWQNNLPTMPEPFQIPTDFTRPGRPGSRAGQSVFELPPRLTRKLRALANSEETTMSTVLLCAYKILLYRYSGQSDLIVGTPAVGRNRSRDSRVVGYYVNPLPIYSDCRGNPEPRDFLRQVRQFMLGALAHQDLPFPMIVNKVQREGNFDASPLYQVMFVYQTELPGMERGASLLALDQDGSEVSIGTLSFENLAFEKRHTQYDLCLSAAVTKDDGICVNLTYDAQLFKYATIERLGKHYRKLLEGLTGEGDFGIASLPLLSRSERLQILDVWNRTENPAFGHLPIHQKFAARAQERGPKTALIYKQQIISYESLNRRVNRLAHGLSERGISGGLIAVCLPRSPELLSVLLAILKAGATYLPLEPTHPEDHRSKVAHDAGISHLIAIETLQGPWTHIDPRVLAAQDCYSSSDHEQRVEPQALAYLLYTSGSTGEPKGVGVSHHALANFLDAMCHSPGISTDDRLLAVTSITFDMAVFENWFAFCGGATVIIQPEEDRVDAARIAKALVDYDISLMQATPATWELLVADGWTGKGDLRVITGGDALSPALAKFLDQRCRSIWNLYGPTEATVFASRTRVQVERGVHIGKPIENMQCYILDRSNQPVPVGIPGQLCISGLGLAQGYHRKAAITATAFIPNPYVKLSGARLYQTGDVARFLPDGSIEFLGRIDHQIKLHGYRIEPAAVEQALNKHPHISRSVVISREDRLGTRQLIAYVLMDPPAHEREVREFLLKHIPDYMVPNRYVFLETFPTSSNGKLDRAALPDPPESIHPIKDEGPVTETERQLCKIWTEVLDRKDVGLNDNFFALGGHSLSATRLIAQIRHNFGRDLRLQDLFSNPTIALLASRLHQSEHQRVLPLTVSKASVGPLSPAQRRIWFMQRMGGGHAYHMPFVIKLHGDLDVARLETAIQTLFERHDILRTIFNEVDGVARQFVQTYRASGLTVVQAADSALPLIKERFFASDLKIDRLPLFKTLLIRHGDEHLLLGNTHHLIADGWSFRLMAREIAENYQQHSLPKQEHQYLDYALATQNESHQKDLQWWLDHLKNRPPHLNLPYDKPAPKVRSFNGHQVPLALDGSLTEALENKTSAMGTTLYAALACSLDALLYLYTGQSDICIGTAVANRPQLTLQQMLGCFVCMTILHIQGHDNNLEGRLQLWSDSLRRSRPHESLPFEMLVEAMEPKPDLSRPPLFQVVLDYQGENVTEIRLGPCQGQVEMVAANSAKFDITLSLGRSETGLKGYLEVSSELFEPTFADQFAQRFQLMAQAVCYQANQDLAEIDLLTETEKQRLLHEMAGYREDLQPAGGLLEMFQHQVNHNPDRLAIRYVQDQGPAEEITYRELHQRVGQLATALRERGIAQEQIVGICLESSIDFMVSVLAVMHAGGVFLPMDPGWPTKRLEMMFQDSRARLLITRSHQENVPRHLAQVVIEPTAIVDDILNASPRHPLGLAYIIYTSGSSGTPKGVAVADLGLTNATKILIKDLGLSEHSRMLQFSSTSFDASVLEWAPAIFGGSLLCLAPRADLLPGPSLIKVLREEAISHWVATPTVLANVPVADLPDLKVVVSAGEVCTQAIVDRWQTGRKVVNVYGPTEVTIFATVYPVSRETPIVPLGHPAANITMYIMSPLGRLNPMGIPGELHIGGPGVTRGYLGRPALTAQRYLPDPHASEPGSRLYKTGDLVRHDHLGQVLFMGRIDQQVKLRGFRIEPGEIEAHLLRHQQVRQAAVLVTHDQEQQAHLVAYISGGPFHGELDDLRAFLRQDLPEHMIPSIFMVLAELPLTPGGKLNRNALPQPQQQNRRLLQPPRTETEKRLASLWSQLLQRGHVDAQDNFFEIGGHSLTAVKLLHEIRQHFGVDLKPITLFENATLVDLAAVIERGQGEAVISRTIQARAKSDKKIPLSYAQERMWFLSRLGDQSDAVYNVPLRLRIEGQFSATRFVKALQELCADHEIMRTSFPAPGGHPHQRIHDSENFPTTIIEANSEQDAITIARAAALTRFKLDKKPPWKALILRLSPRTHELILICHHILMDYWSVSLFIEDLSRRYHDLPTIKPRIQYTDFALWQRNERTAGSWSDHLKWWRTHLKGAPTRLELPLSRSRPTQYPTDGKLLPISFSEDETTALTTFCQEMRHSGMEITMLQVMHTCFALLMRSYSLQSDVVVGTPVVNRNPRDVANLLGFFTNVLPIRFSFTGDGSFRELLLASARNMAEAQEYQELPFEIIVEDQGNHHPSFSPVFQVMVAAQQELDLSHTFQACHSRALPIDTGTAKYELTLFVTSGENISVAMEYNSVLFSERFANQLANHFRNLLLQSISQAETPFLQLSPLTRDEQHTMLQVWNQTSSEPPTTVWHLFDASVRHHPNSNAIFDERLVLTYEDLHELVIDTANSLWHSGIRAEDLVGIQFEDSLWPLTALLSLLKIGAVPVPIDPSLDETQRQRILAEVPLKRIIHFHKNPTSDPQFLSWHQLMNDNVPVYHHPTPTPGMLAYVVFTSGTTGRPRAVGMTHQGFANLLRWYQNHHPPTKSLLRFASPGFDMCFYELFTTWSTGGCVYLTPFDNRLDRDFITDFLASHQIEKVMLPVTVFKLWAEWFPAREQQFDSLREIITAGEQLQVGPQEAAFLKAHPHLKLHNHYGPSETHVTVVHEYNSLEQDQGNVPIGRAVSNTQVYVLDPQLHLVPPGVQGELYIAGDQLARGYIGRPERTATAFIPHPYAEHKY